MHNYLYFKKKAVKVGGLSANSLILEGYYYLYYIGFSFFNETLKKHL